MSHFSSLQEIKKYFVEAFNPNQKSHGYSVNLKKNVKHTKQTLKLKKNGTNINEVKFEVITLTLDKIDDQSEKTREIFEFCLDRMGEMGKRIKDLENDVASLQDENEKVLEMLDEYTQDKKNLEIDLYEKFTRILNEKKQKIKELKQNLKGEPKQD